MRQQLAAIATTIAVLSGNCSTAIAQLTGHVDSSNIGVAIEDAVISSELPDANLDVRVLNEVPGQQLLNTTSDSDYLNPAAGASAHEFMIFKFDFSSLPAGAAATGPVWFDFSAWFTLEEGMPEEAVFGRFKFYEITSGNVSWTDRYITEETANPNPVTWNSLNGTFVELAGVSEDNTDPPDNTTGLPFGVLHPGLLVSNGGFDGANRIVGIPVDAVNRLISGASIGLAMGSVPPPTPELPGDYDGDADVDGTDFLVWQRQLGDTVQEGIGADGSRNGVIDAEDLSIWASNYGSPPLLPTEGATNFSIATTENAFSHPLSSPTLNFDWSAPTPFAAVPESSSLNLWVLAIFLIRIGRRWTELA
jgi:hypothetical protein